MRICLVSFEFLPRTGFGGAAALYTDLASSLAKKGHDVTVLAGGNTPGLTIDAKDNLRILCFGKRTLRPRALACAERAVRVFRQFRTLVKEGARFDVVESPELAAEPLLVNSLSKLAPAVTRLVTPHYLMHRMNQRRRLLTVDWMERKNAALSDLVVGDSRAWAEGILDDWGIDKSKLRICPLGIDLARIDNVVRLPPPLDPPYVLFAGRLTLAKGPQVLAAAAGAIAEEHPEVKIVFAGGDTNTGSGESVMSITRNLIAPSARESAVFLGFVKSWDDLVNLYRNATVSVKADVYTNHSYDTLGQMACGRPLVCSRAGAHTEMIEEGRNGFLFDRENPSELADLVNGLLSDAELRNRIGRTARETVERRYSSSVLASETLKIYEEVIA